MTFRWSSASPSYCPKNCGEKLRHLVQQHLDLHFSPVTLLFQHLIAQCFPVFPTGSTFENFPNVSLRNVFLVFAVVEFVGVEFSSDHFQVTMLPSPVTVFFTSCESLTISNELLFNRQFLSFSSPHFSAVDSQISSLLDPFNDFSHLNEVTTPLPQSPSQIYEFQRIFSSGLFFSESFSTLTPTPTPVSDGSDFGWTNQCFQH